jgi:hypothetical protein
MLHTCNPSTPKVQAGGSRSSRPAWTTQHDSVSKKQTKQMCKANTINLKVRHRDVAINMFEALDLILKKKKKEKEKIKERENEAQVSYLKTTKFLSLIFCDSEFTQKQKMIFKNSILITILKFLSFTQYNQRYSTPPLLG